MNPNQGRIGFDDGPEILLVNTTEDIEGQFTEAILRQAHQEILAVACNFAVANAHDLQHGASTEKLSAKIGKHRSFTTILDDVLCFFVAGRSNRVYQHAT